MWRRGIVSPVPILIAAMLAVALAFGSAILYFEQQTRRVSRETEGMLASGVPSADQLNRVRAALRNLDASIDCALLDMIEQRPIDRGALVEAREHMREELAEYRVFPYYTFEEDLNRDLDHELVRLDENMHRLLDEIAAGKLLKAMELDNGPWRRQSDIVDDRLSGLIAFNIRHVTDHALRIDRIRRRAALVGLTVGGLALVVAMAATAVAAWAMRRHMRLQGRRAAELEMFSSRVAHDLMSPLTSVALALELGRTEASNEQMARYINRALSSTRRMRGVVDGLLDFARSGGQPLPGTHCEVAPVINAVIEESRSSAEQGSIELVCEQVPAGEVGCSTGILTVVLTNLLNNAIKFMGESLQRRITLRAYPRGTEAVRFEVADTGPGLPPAFEQHAFEPYVRATTRVPGLGLGLATVKRLVCAYGGCVGVARGEGGAGSLFWFELPRPTPTV